MTQLPPPSPAALAHSARLADHIRRAIEAAGGAIDFARYMELALYAPGLGYYSAGARKFGAAGDFVTAPELSPLFGRCLARQCADVLETLGGGDLLEAGGGSGVLAAELLRTLERQGTLPERYWLLEPSADLRQRQRQLLEQRVPHLMGRIHWLEGFPASPLRGVLIANEVLDAMPAHRFRVEDHRPLECTVEVRDGAFAWGRSAPSQTLTQALDALLPELNEPLLAGYESEINPAAEAWVGTLGEVLEQGLALLVDYGFPRLEYYHPQRFGGTLQCHYRHHSHPDPFFLPGLQDITAHVDFTAMAEAAVSAGLDVVGYTTQAQFLLNTGLLEQLGDADLADLVQHTALSLQVSLLTSPAEMGELFKVIGLGRGLDLPLRGFARGDRRGRL